MKANVILKKKMSRFKTATAFILLASCLSTLCCGGAEQGPALVSSASPSVLHTAAPSPSALPISSFDSASCYIEWADKVGQPSGLLFPKGAHGINLFMTREGLPGYDSGRIVIGDSRCCQLGIFQHRIGGEAFAAFAYWGGHYVENEYPQIMSRQLVSAVERCFKRQIESCGKCTIFFFATVNDYDPSGDNTENIAAAIAAAERLASMEYEYGGRLHRPDVFVVGFDGFRTDSEPSSKFNGGIRAYSEALKEAVHSSPLLGAFSSSFTTVPEITQNGTSYIDDGLHYSDKTLEMLYKHIAGR